MEAAVKWEIKKDYVEWDCYMTRELQPHHLTGYSLSAFDLWKREMEMQGGNGLTEQKTFRPDDAMPAVTGCCLTMKEVIEWGGRGEGCLALPPSTLVSEYVFSWSRCFVEAHSGPTCGKQQQHHLSIASQSTWPQNLASCCQICLSSMRYSGNAEEKKKCPEMWGWVMVFSAWGCYKQPCTHMLYFVAGGDSCTEKPLSSTWYELTETSRKSNWLLASDSNSHSWSADITSSYIHLFTDVRCYIAKHCMAHAFMGVMFPAGRAEALCHKQGLSETSPFFFNGISGISLCY